MKLKIVSLVLAIAAPLVASAAAPTGKVGSVTVALTTITYQGGFKDSNGDPAHKKEIVNTDTLYTYLDKYVTIKAKYTNKEFIADLITKGTLTGVAADWSLKYVDAAEIGGLYALNKNGVTAVYLGTQNGYALAYNFNGGYAYDQLDTNITTRIANVDQQTTYKGSYTETDAVTVTLSPLSGLTYVAAAFHNFGEGYSSVYNELTDTYLTDTYSVPAQSFSDIVGYNDSNSGGGLISGSIKISALKDNADVSVYVSAYNAAHG